MSPIQKLGRSVDFQTVSEQLSTHSDWFVAKTEPRP